MTPDRTDELIALATLGELTEADERELSDAVARDPVLAAELDEALATAAALQRGSAQEPPAGLRASVLSAIAQTPQERADIAPGSASEHFPEREVRPPVSLNAERQRRRRWGPLLVAAAAVIVFVAGAAVLVSNDDASAPDQYAAVLDAPDAETHDMAGDLSGSLTVTYSSEQDAMVVTGTGIPTLSDDETYQLWFDIDGQMTSGGLFRPDADGNVEERIDGVETTGASINLTEEPAGGSESPTLPVLASSA